MRLLILDDSVVVRNRLTEILSEVKGIEIVGTLEGSHRAIGIIEKSKPDVIILDVRMPGLDGISILESIRMRKNSPLVIMFTNFPYLQYRKKCLDAGADFFFYKTLEFEKLIQLIRDLAKK